MSSRMSLYVAYHRIRSLEGCKKENWVRAVFWRLALGGRSPGCQKTGALQDERRADDERYALLFSLALDVVVVGWPYGDHWLHYSIAEAPALLSFQPWRPLIPSRQALPLQRGDGAPRAVLGHHSPCLPSTRRPCQCQLPESFYLQLKPWLQIRLHFCCYCLRCLEEDDGLFHDLQHHHLPSLAFVAEEAPMPTSTCSFPNKI